MSIRGCLFGPVGVLRRRPLHQNGITNQVKTDFRWKPRGSDAPGEPSAPRLPFSHMIVGFPEQKTRFGRSRKAAEGQWMKLHCWAVYAEIRKSPKREKFSGFQVVCSPGPIRKRHFGRHAKTPDENGSNSIRLLKYHVRREKWATFGGTRGPQRAPGCQIWSQLACHCLVRLMITTPKGPVLGQNAPFGGLGGPPRDQIWSQMSPGPNSRGRIGNVMKCQESWNVKSHEMSRVMKCQMSRNVKCHETSKVTKLQKSWNVKCQEMSWNVKSHEMLNVMKCQESWNVKCHDMSSVMKCRMSWNFKYKMSRNGHEI